MARPFLILLKIIFPQELFQAVPTDVGICCAFNFNSTMKETVYARCRRWNAKYVAKYLHDLKPKVDCGVEAEGEQRGGEVEGAGGEEGQGWL